MAYSLLVGYVCMLFVLGQCDFAPLDTLRQSNGYDCGIHVLCNVVLVANQVMRQGRIAGCPMISYSAVSNKRSELLDIIDGLRGR